MPDSINAALVGRNSIVREGLCRILAGNGFEVRASTPTLSALHGLIGVPWQAELCLVIIDLGTDGCEEGMIAAVHEAWQGSHVVLLADKFDFETMLLAFGQGASGYIVKEISCGPLVAALQLAATGEKVLPSQLADVLPAHAPSGNSDIAQKTIDSAQLSGRETEILRCLIMGCPNKIISRQLRISEATVKVHVKAILRKIRVHNRTQAAIWAVNRGLEGISFNRSGEAFRPEPIRIQVPTVPPQIFVREPHTAAAAMAL